MCVSGIQVYLLSVSTTKGPKEFLLFYPPEEVCTFPFSPSSFVSSSLFFSYIVNIGFQSNQTSKRVSQWLRRPVADGYPEGFGGEALPNASNES
jgi:hypothetical protein